MNRINSAVISGVLAAVSGTLPLPRREHLFDVGVRCHRSGLSDNSAVVVSAPSAGDVRRERFVSLRTAYARLQELDRLADAGGTSDQEHQERVGLRRQLLTGTATSKYAAVNGLVDELRKHLGAPVDYKGDFVGEASTGGETTQEKAWKALRWARNEVARRDGHALELIPVDRETIFDGIGCDFLLVNRRNADCMLIDAKQVRRGGGHGDLRIQGTLILPQEMTSRQIQETAAVWLDRLVATMERDRTALNLFTAMIPVCSQTRPDSTSAHRLKSCGVDSRACIAVVHEWQALVREREQALSRYASDLLASQPLHARLHRFSIQGFAESTRQHAGWLGRLEASLVMLAQRFATADRRAITDGLMQVRALFPGTNETRRGLGGLIDTLNRSANKQS